MMRKWTLVPLFAAIAAITWAQPPSGAPLDRESREETETSAEQRTRDARRGRATPEPDAQVRRGQRPAPADPDLERPVVQRMDPAAQTPAASPDISGKRARPELGEPGAIDIDPTPPTQTTPAAMPGTPTTPNFESIPPTLRDPEKINRTTPAITPVGTPADPSAAIVTPGVEPAPVALPEAARERVREAQERLRQNPAPDTDNEVERPTPGTRPRQTLATETPDAAGTPRTGISPAPGARTGEATPTPASSPDILPSPRITQVTPAAPPADATPFVPADMPDRLRKGTEPDRETPRPGATPDAAETPDADETPAATKRTPATPGVTPETVITPRTDTTTPRAADPGRTDDATPTPDASPSPGASPSPRTSPTPVISPIPRTSPTPAVSPLPGTSPTPSTRPSPAADTGDRRPGQRRGQGTQRPAIEADEATAENLNQAAEQLLSPGTPGPRPVKRDPAQVQLTPWVQPKVVTGEQAVDTSAQAEAVVVLPAGATPTPTPAPERIIVSDPQIINNIQNITIAPTPPPAPTPGPTPVPTPPGVTPVPRDWRPERDWVPYPGWRPPNDWRPPTGWVPPGGWSPAPGWEPPREWVPRLRDWGWQYIARRGWVVPVQWTPPPDFVVPPNWYYLPPHAYEDYGFYNPAEVIVMPGRARPDLIVNVDVTQIYTPPAPPPVILTGAPPPPPRPAPAAPPVIPLQMTQVENVVEVLSRPRQPDAPRYEGPVLVTGSVHFGYDSYAIQPDSFPTLDAIGMALVEEMPDAIINIEGHTDSDGSDEYNQNLSEQRAWSVKSYLVQKFGIDPNRLITVGYGERAPIADNRTDSGKAMNRRAEFENVTDLYSAQVVEVETAVPGPGATEY